MHSIVLYRTSIMVLPPPWAIWFQGFFAFYSQSIIAPIICAFFNLTSRNVNNYSQGMASSSVDHKSGNIDKVEMLAVWILFLQFYIECSSLTISTLSIYNQSTVKRPCSVRYRFVVQVINGVESNFHIMKMNTSTCILKLRAL